METPEENQTTNRRGARISKVEDYLSGLKEVKKRVQQVNGCDWRKLKVGMEREGLGDASG